MRTTTFEMILAATALSLFSLTFGSGAAQGATNHPSEPIRGHEECTPLHAVSVLRNHVQWSARENAPVALAAEFTSETIDGASDFLAWRLVLTTMDRTVVDSRTGTSRLNDGRSIVAETFDGRDSAGHPLAPGLYVYRFEADEYEGSGGFLRVYGSDETPDAPVGDTREPLATSTNPSVPYNFYFGSQHAHTNYSDGGTAVATCTGSVSSPHAGASPTDAFAYAKNSGGVDWICVIEHNHLMDDACGTGCTTATIQGRYHDGLNAAIAATTPNFVGIYGMEYGVIGQPVDQEGHVALYDVTKLLSWEAYAEVTTSKTDYLSTWTTANNPANQGANGAAGAFCHPKTSDYNTYAQNAAGLNLIRGVAVISGPAFAPRRTSPTAARATRAPPQQPTCTSSRFSAAGRWDPRLIRTTTAGTTEPPRATGRSRWPARCRKPASWTRSGIAVSTRHPTRMRRCSSARPTTPIRWARSSRRVCHHCRCASG